MSMQCVTNYEWLGLGCIEYKPVHRQSLWRSRNRQKPAGFAKTDPARDPPAPPALSSKLLGARFPLYRSQILQENTRWKALAEIYTMHSFAPLSILKISSIFQFSEMFANFARMLLNFRQIYYFSPQISWTSAGISGNPRELLRFSRICSEILIFF